MIIVRLVGHSKDLWPRALHVKHLMSLVLSVASEGVVDDEALCLELLVVVVRRLKDVVGCLELDLSPVLGVDRVVEGVVEVVEA